MRKVCQWCGDPSTGRVVVAPEVVGRRKRVGEGGTVPYVECAAIEADVCARHREMVEREADATEKRKRRDRLRSVSGELMPDQKAELRRLEEALS